MTAFHDLLRGAIADRRETYPRSHREVLDAVRIEPVGDLAIDDFGGFRRSHVPVRVRKPVPQPAVQLDVKYDEKHQSEDIPHPIATADRPRHRRDRRITQIRE